MLPCLLSSILPDPRPALCPLRPRGLCRRHVLAGYLSRQATSCFEHHPQPARHAARCLTQHLQPIAALIRPDNHLNSLHMRGETGLTPRRFIRPSPAIRRSLVCLLFVLVAGSSSGVHDLDYLLAVLNQVDGVTGANHFGTEGDRRTQYGVHLKVRVAPGAPRQMKRIPCSSNVGWSKLDAALKAREHVCPAH